MRLTQFIIALILTTINGEIIIPGLSRECYTQPGDVLFGGIFDIMAAQNKQVCEPNISRGSFSIQRIEAIKFAIDEINKTPSILPNITIGFVFLDSCGINHFNLGQAMRLLQDDNMVLAPDVTPCGVTDERHNYDVIAVIGAGRSSYTLPVALAMTAGQISLIGTSETSDELSDKTRFGYFIPFSLPDSYQSKAILDLLSHHNWTYFSIIYKSGTYGENAVKEIQKNIDSYGLCLEQSFAIPDYGVAYMNDKVYPRLLHSTISRVIVLLTGDPKIFFDNLPERLYKHFVYVGSDATSYSNPGEPAEGMLVVNLQYVGSESFEAYYRSLTPFNNAANPWWRYMWHAAYGCTWDPETVQQGRENCLLYENYTLPETTVVYDLAAIYIDAVYTAAHGLHLLLNKTCPEAFSDNSTIRKCINGPEYMSAIKNVSFEGLSGRIEFNENGEIGSEYILTQYSGKNNSKTVVGTWHNVRGLHLSSDRIDWRPFNQENLNIPPTSVCSSPCQPRQYVIKKEVICCWECHYCRNNEILVRNGTSCEVCQENSWPDQETATVCLDIPPTYLHMTDSLGIGLTILAVVGIIGDTLTALMLFFHRDRKLIKASSRELIAIILVGIMLAFVSSLITLTKPSPRTCFLKNLGFMVSVTSIYSPLLTKTVRVFRIFGAGEKGMKSLALISSRSQLALAILLLLIEVVIAVVVGMVRPSLPLSRMPVLTQRYSELICTLPPDVLVILLAYNFLLLITCAIFGFLTRKLPENFNESWFIFISVVTTVFIWIVFLPTYFTTFYAIHKTALLATCLLLNGYITLVCLFVPKIYAIYFVEEAKIKFISNTASVSVTGTSTVPTATY